MHGGLTNTHSAAGLDFLNHDSRAACWWDVLGSLSEESGFIELRCGARRFPAAGEELCIRYQDAASNGALLLRYGFVEEQNRADFARIQVPMQLGATAASGHVRQKQLQLLTVRCQSCADAC